MPNRAYEKELYKAEASQEVPDTSTNLYVATCE